MLFSSVIVRPLFFGLIIYNLSSKLKSGRTYVLVGVKLCSRVLETMFLWGRSYVPYVVML